MINNNVMNNWLYNIDGAKMALHDNFKTDSFGFIYKITNLETGKFYIGKKVFVHNKKKKLTKKELAEQSGPGRKSTIKIVQVESDWKKYWGSSKELLSDVKLLGEDKFERLIISFCPNKKQLTYMELFYQMHYNVLVVDSYNDNILGKFFRKDLIEI